MNLPALKAAWAARERGATTAELLVALALADHADRAGRAWPGRRALANKTGLSEATVKRSLARLRALGVIETVTGGRGRGRLAVYVFSAAEKGAPPIPFPGPKGAVRDPFSAGEKGSGGARKRGQEAHTGTYSLNHRRAGADGGRPEGLVALRAQRLADAVARRGDAALVLADWHGEAVARIAILQHGADPEALARHGCAVPSELRARAVSR